MVILSTSHAHTTYADGANTPREMVEAAISRGFHSLGLSEHGAQVYEPYYGMRAEEEYRDEVKRLKVEYADRIALFLGIERDSYGVSDPSPYEYTIGSKHYFRVDGQYFPVDGRLEDVRKGLDQLFDGDWYTWAECYFRELADFIVSEPPTIIGHFDLLTKHNEGERLFDESDPRYVQVAYEALERMLPTGALLEVNTGAIARGYRNAPYPALKLLTFWRERGGRTTLSSDCHDARKIDAGYDQGYALMKAAGYRTAWALGNAEQLFVEYEI